MKKLLPLLMFLTFSGFRPVAVTTQSAKGINENFNSLASEIERRSLNQGGIVHQNLKISSSAHVTGDVVVDGNLKVPNLTISDTIVNPAIPTTYGVWITSDTPPISANADWALNITSITTISAGEFRVTLTTPMAHTGYGVLLGQDESDSSCSLKSGSFREVRHFRIFCENTAGTNQTPEKITIVMYGLLDP